MLFQWAISSKNWGEQKQGWSEASMLWCEGTPRFPTLSVCCAFARAGDVHDAYWGFRLLALLGWSHLTSVKDRTTMTKAKKRRNKNKTEKVLHVLWVLLFWEAHSSLWNWFSSFKVSTVKGGELYLSDKLLYNARNTSVAKNAFAVQILNASSFPELIFTELLTFIFSVIHDSKRNT